MPLKTSLSLLALLLTGITHAAGVYKFDPVHTQVVFYVSHLGFSNSSGRLHVADGAFQFDEKDWSKSQVQATIHVSSLDMGDPTWKEHLSGERFLDAAKFPNIEFKSTRVEAVAPQQLRIHGDLTMHGVTKPVILDTRVNKIGTHPMSKRPAAGFTATAKVKRSDFGMTNLIPMVGDELDLRIEVEGSVPAAK